MEINRTRGFDLEKDFAKLFESEEKVFMPQRKRWYKRMHKMFAAAISKHWGEVKEKLIDNAGD